MFKMKEITFRDQEPPTCFDGLNPDAITEYIDFSRVTKKLTACPFSSLLDFYRSRGTEPSSTLDKNASDVHLANYTGDWRIIKEMRTAKYGYDEIAEQTPLQTCPNDSTIECSASGDDWKQGFVCSRFNVAAKSLEV